MTAAARTPNPPDQPALTSVESGTDRPLVLLMGLGAGADAWQPHSSVWSRSHRCIAVNNPGVGGSELPDAELSTASMASAVATLIADLGVGPCDVAGISMGAGIAQELALRHPETVSRLVLVAPWARADAWTRSVLTTLAGIRDEASTRTFNETLRNLVWTPEWVDDGRDDDAALDVEPAMSQHAFRAQARACVTHDTLDRLVGIAVPTLVTWGDRDIFIRPGLSRLVADGIPGAESRVYPDLGHVHHWEALDRFNAEVDEWLR